MNAHPLADDLEQIAASDPPLWEGLRDARIFVSGGTGFVGTWLVEAFAWANRRRALGASLAVLTRDPDRFAAREPQLARDPAIVLVRGDCTAFSPPPGRFDLLVHAAVEPAGSSPAAEWAARDLAATRSMLAFARASGVRKALLTSSGAAYGPQAAGLDRIPETYRAPEVDDATTDYGRAKRASERAWCDAASETDIDATIARLFAFVGPHLPLDANYAVGNFLGDALAGRSVQIAGDGTALRSYLYAADLALWLWTILLRGERGRAYNVGSPHAVTIAELAALIVGTTRTPVATVIAGVARAGVPAQRYVPDVSRARNELGLRPVTSLIDAIRRTYRWHRERAAAATPTGGVISTV